LITGGLGYIGSHICAELIKPEFEIVVIDNLSNSSKDVIERIKTITNQAFKFYEVDIRDKNELRKIFDTYNFSSVIHLAGLKSVSDSIQSPLKYFDNNVNGTLSLLEVMEENKCYEFIFSSSATVYGVPESLPIREDLNVSPNNPYGEGKVMCEKILNDISLSNPNWKIGILRYFNPIGAHPSGLIGENPNGTPNNLLPYVTMVAYGELECVNVFGDDYPTPDGSGVRDYIHVVDLAKAHVKMLEKLSSLKEPINIFNIGTGEGFSVLEIISTFERISGREIPYKIVPRRHGDIAECFADATLANKYLGWYAENTLEEMILSTCSWMENKKQL